MTPMLNGPHDLKSTYQRHMVIGMVAAAILLIVPAWILAHLHPSIRDQQSTLDSQRSTVTGIQQSSAGPKKTLPQSQTFHGQFGVKVRIIPDHPAAAKPPLKRRPVPRPALELPPTVDAGSYASDITDTVPGPVAEGELSLGESGGSIYRSPDRDTIGVLSRTDPDYPLVANQAGKEGRVSLLVYVDSLGRLADFPADVQRDSRVHSLDYVLEGYRQTLEYCVIAEEPRDWFFARNLLRVIPKWRFLPKTNGGIPIGDFLVVTYRYCRGVNCSSIQLQSRN